MVNQALPSLEELKAVLDEAHRRGMFVASHTYGGDGLKWAIEAGVDDIQHAVAATDEEKAAARKTAGRASRINFILSIPMIMCMGGQAHGLPF